jgi:hypothetical protein
MKNYLLAGFIFLLTFQVNAQNNSFDLYREQARASVAQHLHNAKKLRTKFQPVIKVIGNIVVIEASVKSGTMHAANKFDLSGKVLQFNPAGDGTYTTNVSNATPVNPSGELVQLQPGDVKSIPLGFSFPFYRSNFKSVFVHANGNLTFAKAAKPPLGLSDLELFHISPRIAPLDLYILFSSAQVFVQKNSNQATFTWKIRSNSDEIIFETTLNRDGNITFQFGKIPVDVVAVSGITPGPVSQELPQYVDFSGGTVRTSRNAAIELFSSSSTVDPIAITKAFLSSQSDRFDMLALFYSIKHPGRPSFPGTGVDVIYQSNIKGIGRSLYNYSKVLGSKGKLKAVASFFDFESYPSDPLQFFQGYTPDTGRTPLWLVSHEIGHLWLASVKIMENGVRTTNLLSDCCHWSFTFDSDASFMHGNDIRDNSNGTFITTDVDKRFSLLDQYLMGLIPASDVPPMFYVANAVGVSTSDYAKKDVTFSGTRVNVDISQVIAAEGPRLPASNTSQRAFNVGFALIVDEGRKPSDKELSKLERIRTEWPAYFKEAASNRISVSTTLNRN